MINENINSKKDNVNNTQVNTKTESTIIEAPQDKIPNAEVSIDEKLQSNSDATKVESGELIDIARTKWSSIKSEARNNNNKAGALMNSGCFVKDLNDNKLIIGFKFPTHVDLVKNSDNGNVLIAIQDAVNKILNSNLIIDVEVAEQDVSGDSSKEESMNQDQGQHLVDEAIKRGAKIVD